EDVITELDGKVIDDLDLVVSDTTIPQGLTIKATATAVFVDGSRLDISQKVTWGSSDESILTVRQDVPGLYNAVKIGRATLKAEFRGLSERVDVEIISAEIEDLTITGLAIRAP